MALITCRKCKRIVASSTEPCPYCGEPEPGAGHVEVDPDSRHWSASNTGAVFVLIALVILLLVQWIFRNDASRLHNENVPVSAYGADCQTSECDAGTKGVTISSRMQPYYTCKSNELSEYANEVLKVMIDQVQLHGVAPEISSRTGEPVVQGSEKATLDQYRAKAQVPSFEGALSKCYRGRAGQQVVVLYSPKESRSIYVSAEKDQTNKFWLPKSRVVRISR
jgi:hypothetical protein